MIEATNNERIYTERKILTGVLLGGPLAGGYYFWRTFKTLGLSRQAKIAPIAGVVLLVLIYSTAFIPPLDRIPNFVSYGLQIGLTYGIYRGFVAERVVSYLQRDGRLFGWGNTLLVGAICLVLTLIPAVAIFYSIGGFQSPSVRYYGSLRHEIQYDSSNITPAEIDSIAKALTKAGFFDTEQQKTVDAAKDGDRYVLNLYCNESARDPEFISIAKGLRDEVQRAFPNNHIVIDLVIGTPDTRIARLE